MDAKRQSYWWWFDSHNSPRCSPWLQSTLAVLDEKTKAMLKLIDEDADSFAQRAEMYYKKRPELISMVEDFYRTHRSLAERYDQLRVDPSVRVRSPLRHSFSHPKSEYEKNVLVDSVKSFDSSTFSEEEAYNSEECAESEVDDPEEDEVDDGHVEQDGYEREKRYEPIKLSEELDRLRAENEIQKNQIKEKDKEKEELITQLSDNSLILTKQTSDMMKIKDDIESLKAQLKRKEEEMIDATRRIEAAKCELMIVTEGMKMNLKDELEQKDEEKREVIRQLSLGMEMLREENQLLKKSIIKGTPKKWNPPEIQIFKNAGLRKLFGSSCWSQTSIVPL